MSAAVTPSPSATRRAALFDFDGTLGITLPSWTAAFGAAIREHGHMPTEEEVIRSCFHTPTEEAIKNFGISDSDAFKKRVWASIMELMASAEHYPGVPETLQALRDEGFMLAVVTNSRRSAVEPVLRRWKVHHHFEEILTIDDVSNGKPDPEMIHRAINLLDLSPSDTYIIGDSRADVTAGKNAGIRTIGFSPEENRKYLAFDILQALAPSHLVHSYDHLREVLGLSKPLPAERQAR